MQPAPVGVLWQCPPPPRTVSCVLFALDTCPLSCVPGLSQILVGVFWRDRFLGAGVSFRQQGLAVCWALSDAGGHLLSRHQLPEGCRTLIF